MSEYPKCFGYIMENKEVLERENIKYVTDCKTCTLQRECIEQYNWRVYGWWGDDNIDDEEYLEDKSKMRFFTSINAEDDYAEIFELHHERKADAPSGTALATARAMLSARGRPFEHPATAKETLAGTRGGVVDGISIHSVRLPGLVAHQEVILGTLGQSLTIRHDTTSRESFMPGVLLAIREVMNRQELVVGLDKLIGLD